MRVLGLRNHLSLCSESNRRCAESTKCLCDRLLVVREGIRANKRVKVGSSGSDTIVPRHKSESISIEGVKGSRGVHPLKCRKRVRTRVETKRRRNVWHLRQILKSRKAIHITRRTVARIDIVVGNVRSAAVLYWEVEEVVEKT